MRHTFRAGVTDMDFHRRGAQTETSSLRLLRQSSAIQSPDSCHATPREDFRLETAAKVFRQGERLESGWKVDWNPHVLPPSGFRSTRPLETDQRPCGADALSRVPPGRELLVRFTIYSNFAVSATPLYSAPLHSIQKDFNINYMSHAATERVSQSSSYGEPVMTLMWPSDWLRPLQAVSSRHSVRIPAACSTGNSTSPIRPESSRGSWPEPEWTQLQLVSIRQFTRSGSARIGHQRGVAITWM